MSTEELDVVRVVYLRTGADGTAPAFVIDGRDYTDDEAVMAAVEEAWDALEARGMVAEFETRPADERPAWLPTWHEYRPTLPEPTGGQT